MRKLITWDANAICRRTTAFFFLSIVGLMSGWPAYATAYLEANGHYSLSGETRTHPVFDKESGYFQAIKQNFGLDTEFRVSDKSSLWMQFKVFDDPREAYLGDKPQPKECSPRAPQSDGSTGAANTGNADNCSGRYQNTSEPGYAAYTPKITELYVVHANDYCLIKAGRRPRNWGLGAFMSAGDGPFDTSQSVYDGISCDVNIQKTQLLGFSFGLDKLTETGSPVEADVIGNGKGYGAFTSSDDLDQYFLTIEYDDRKTNVGSGLTKNIGFYFANIVSEGNGPKTDVKILDLFTAFYLRDLTYKNELIFRMGKSADPSFVRLGGMSSIDGNIVTNDVQSVGAAGALEYTLAHSGEIVGPADYHQGNAESHSLFLEYAFAPGDRGGYQKEFDGAGNFISTRTTSASAMAFHRNYKPAMILFNSPTSLDYLRVDGIFDPDRVMNATVIAAGYRYKSLETGNFELRLISAQLNEAMPAAEIAQEMNSQTRLIGYAGRSLGWELDLKYDRPIGKYYDCGLGGAAAMPGNAWKIHSDQSPVSDFLVRAFASMKF